MRKILLIAIVIIVVASGGWYWYAKSHQTAPGVPSITNFSAFFPVGDPVEPTLPDGVLPQPTSPDETIGTTTPSPFTQLSPHAVAGFGAFTRQVTVTVPPDPSIPKSKSTKQTLIQHVLRYVSRGNGYVYEIEDGSIPLQISNVYIPNIYEVLFGDKFATVLLRFLRPDQRTIATYSVPIPPANTDGTRTQKPGVYFSDNILAAAVSPDGTQVARLISGTNTATITLSSTTNTKAATLIQTPFREWLISWPSAKTLYLQTKASAQVPGYLYKIDTAEKKLRQVLTGINGLTTSVSPSGTYVLYSQHAPGGFSTRLFNTKTNTTQTLSLAILPEKCTWLKNEDLICAGNSSVAQTAEYPDAWYQGIVSFSDQLYRIYTSTLSYDTLYDNSGLSFDATNLQTDEALGMLYFVDKTTGLLWQFQY